MKPTWEENIWEWYPKPKFSMFLYIVVRPNQYPIVEIEKEYFELALPDGGFFCLLRSMEMKFCNVMRFIDFGEDNFGNRKDD